MEGCPLEINTEVEGLIFCLGICEEGSLGNLMEALRGTVAEGYHLQIFEGDSRLEGSRHEVGSLDS
jgi:hypothetical protein